MQLQEFQIASTSGQRQLHVCLWTPDGAVRALRITGYDGAELGEVAAFSPEGTRLPLRGDAALCDEPDTVPDRLRR